MLAIVTSMIIEAYKLIQTKYGDKATKRAVYLGLFGLSLLWTVLTQTNLISTEAVQEFVKLVIYAVGVYEVLIKNIKRLLPYFGDTISSAPKKR